MDDDMLAVRRASEADSRDLWEWRNDPATREASLSSAPVAWVDHRRWFARALSDDSKAIYIGKLLAGSVGNVGMCRFDVDPSRVSAEVSINLSPGFRGKSLSRPLLSAAIKAFHTDFATVGTLTARIRESNEASKRLFTSVGFCLQGHADGVGTYELSLAN